MSAKKFIDFRLKHLNRNLSISYLGQPFVIKSSKGVFFTDDEDHQLLDCINNVSHIGHCHPEYIRRMHAQMGTLLTNCRFLYPQMISATEKLLKMFPGHLKRVLFVNSGSEANDIAMQMARAASGNQNIYCHEGAYHGITQSCMDVSPYKWTPKYPPPPYTRVLTSPCTYRGKYNQFEDSSDRYARDFQADIDHKGNFAGLITESMLSCAGQIIPKKDYFQKIHKVVKDNKGFYISDEVQTGFWRLGTHPFAFSYFDVEPDVVTIGKAMGNGFPVSAVICTEEVADRMFEGGIEIFPTYGGNPLACVATEAVIDIIEEEKLAQNAKEVGEYVLSKFKEFLRYPRVGDVRGKGLFAGIEFVESKVTKKPCTKTAKRVQQLCRGQNVMLSVDAIALNVVKFKPPIIFSKENADQMFQALTNALDQAHQEMGITEQK
jgi:4-aminobutyrate aminotransferase-like enzyme